MVMDYFCNTYCFTIKVCKGNSLKKILFLSHNYPENEEDLRGSFFVPIIEELLRRGFEINVVCPKWKGKEQLCLEQGRHGEKIHRFGTELSSFTDLNLINPRDLWHFFLLFRNLNHVASMVVKRAKEIPKEHRVLFWHHCLKHIYGYLVHTRL